MDTGCQNLFTILNMIEGVVKIPCDKCGKVDEVTLEKIIDNVADDKTNSPVKCSRCGSRILNASTDLGCTIKVKCKKEISIVLRRCITV